MRYDLKQYIKSSPDQSHVLIFHPFYDANRNYIKWDEANQLYELHTERIPLHIAILHQYFGLATFNDKFIFSSQLEFEQTVLPVYEKLKQIPPELKLLDEQLDLRILKEILTLSGFNRFKCRTTFELAEQEMDQEELLNVYSKYKCWDIETIDQNFKIKNFEDDVVSILSFKRNNGVEQNLLKLSSKIDVEKL